MKQTKSNHQQLHLSACDICNQDSFFADLSYLDLANLTLEPDAVDFSFDLRFEQRVRLHSVVTLVFGVNENSVGCENSDLWLEPLLIVLCNTNIPCRNSKVYMMTKTNVVSVFIEQSAVGIMTHLAALFQLPPHLLLASPQSLQRLHPRQEFDTVNQVCRLNFDSNSPNSDNM